MSDSNSSPTKAQRPTYTSFASILKQSKHVEGPKSHNGGGRRLSRANEEGQAGSSRTERSSSRMAGENKQRKKARLGLWKMMALTVSMGGSQIAWTVELGYGTPYLLSLGLSEQLTSLVWLAGPISGLIAQPLIGAISDSSNSRYRRRYWIVMATLLLVLSGLGLAFTEAIASALVGLFGGGQGDWDPKTEGLVKSTSIGIAVISFYCLDFALNGLQASLRNLVLDVTPGEQLANANAWHGRFNHLGNIVGFTMGFLNLKNVPIIRLVGGGQFRKVCIVALVLLVATIWITCWTQEEDARESSFRERRSKLRDVIVTIIEAVRHLPKPIRRVCIVQIAAFMGWFPYLFYSTTYVAEVMANELGHEPDMDKATRAGSLALLIYSFVAIAAGTILPYLAARDRKVLDPVMNSPAGEDSEDEDEVELNRTREIIRQWKAESARQGRPLKLPVLPFMLRNIWTAGLVLFAILMGSTFFIVTVWQATVVLALVGICWAIACWVPFAIIMEFLKEMDEGKKTKERPIRNGEAGPATKANGMSRPGHIRAVSNPPVVAWRSVPTSPVRTDERTPLARSWSTADLEAAGESLEYTGSGPVAGGTIMGIHNLAIVVPQFLIAIIASLIFKAVDSSVAPAHHSDGESEYQRKTGVAWVLRFGGLMALLGALICRKVPPTKTEKAMRRRLAEMRDEQSNEQEETSDD